MHGNSGRLLCGAVTAIILVHLGLLVWGAVQHSPSLDEVGHLPAGIGHWQYGRFELYCVNPPLVRLVAALPVLCTRAKTASPVEWRDVPRMAPREDSSLFPTQLPARRTEFAAADYFLKRNGQRSFGYFTAARLACLPFTVLGALVCFRWAKELYGAAAGVLALTLWCFCPNILAHAQMITPDAGATAFGVTAAYVFWRWLKGPTWAWTLAAGAALGLAELTKMTWIVLFPLWPVLWIVWRWPERRRLTTGQWGLQAGQLAVILLFALNVMNLGYGFQGSFKRLDSYQFISQALTGIEEAPEGLVVPGNRFAGTWLGSLPVPLPADYLLGIDYSKWEFEQKMWSYLRGEWRKGGWYHYYLYVLAIKVPLGTWMMLLLAALVTALGRGYSASWRDELTLLLPPLVVLVFVSSHTGINHHLRYVLLAFPFAFIFSSKVARAVLRNRRMVAWAGGAALAWSVASSLWIYPHSLSYFNELVGGPVRGHYHLCGIWDSNIDWGQDLFYLKRWVEANPQARPLAIGFNPACDPTVADIMHRRLPPEPLPGWYALSVSTLHDRSEAFSYLLELEPVTMIGYSVYIYHLRLDDANRIRRERGIPELRVTQPSVGPHRE